ncbi:MAG TPA: S24 family peptidase [Polyangia bacterium]|jgi:type III restriction enzyme|nr:S24 family peptidase [Polyangia bacterium]
MPTPFDRSPALGELHGQARVIAEVQRRVDAWRGFNLGRAAEPYPTAAPRYVPSVDGERPISDTTMHLLQHWFRHEPHQLRKGQAFKYWPHQRRLVETFIYLYEVRGIRRTEELYRLAGVGELGPQRDPWAKLGGQLATGSGKTKMMSLLIAWSYLNAVCEGDARLGFGPHAILIAPNLFVKDRLLQDFRPPYGETSVFLADPVVPPAFDQMWNLKVYDSVTCPRLLDPSEGALVVTNYHQLLRESEEAPTLMQWEQHQMDLLFHAGEPDRLEAVTTPLLERFARSRGLLVLNDEAHHVWDEAGHGQFEQKARDKARVSQSEDEATAMAWIRSIRRLNGDGQTPGRVALQVDLSATLFEETGSSARSGKGGKNKAAKEFRPTDLFRHTTVYYPLADAIRDGIVKRPILERVEVRNQKTGQIEAPVRDGQPNAWEKYRNLLVTGIERWKKVRDQLIDEGDPRKPILFILANDRNEAREVANFLRYGEALRDDVTGRAVSGYRSKPDEAPLFVDQEGGVARSTVVEIHIGEKEQKNDAAWEDVRRSVNAVDHDQIPKIDDEGRPVLDAEGRPVLVPNPYNVVVSVMMLKEGWDVRNVKVIVPLRPCDSRTLTEQTLGRGLRKMHPPILDEEGGAFMKTEELYVIEHPSFKAILDQIQDIIEERSSDEIEHAREYVPILQKADLSERQAHGVRLVRFEGLREVVPDWRKTFDSARIPALSPQLAWMEEIADTEIKTFLKEALAATETEGQVFIVPETPSYRDFDHLIEIAMAVPILREMRTSFHHKTAVKGIVREFLERKTFSLPAGLPLSFDRIPEGDYARIALGNLARAEVIAAVKRALLPPLQEAITAERRATEAHMSERRAEELEGYQALKKHVFDAPQKSPFDRAALENADEEAVAHLLDAAKDVTGWIYNHRSGVGYSIEYDWQGMISHYYPDFIARARIGEVFHNFIIEVKGRFDDRDRTKAERGQRYCDLLTEHDREPWHYLLLLENEPVGRQDITWWGKQSRTEIGDLSRHLEGLPLLPNMDSQPRRDRSKLEILKTVPVDQQFREAVPVHDLAAAAGGFSSTQTPETIGWVKIHAQRILDRRMFVAKVVGRSMETAIPDGSWALFRLFPDGAPPAATALDGRRVVVQLRDATDPETGGRYTVKRWRVTATGPDGGAAEIELRPDNPGFKTMRMRSEDGDIRVIAEFLEVVG